MPLEPIEHRDRDQGTSSRVSRRALLGGGAILLVTALTACAEGTVRDAKVGKERDASRESVVKNLQATETWNLVNGTPTPGPSTPEE